MSVKVGPATDGAKIRAAFADDDSFAFIYLPLGEQFPIDKSVIKGKSVSEIWFDPRYGISDKIHTGDAKGIQTYTPPTNGRGNDWILIIKNTEMNFPLFRPKVRT